MTKDDIRTILTRKGYGVASQLSGLSYGAKSQVGPPAYGSEISGAGKEQHLESIVSDASLRSEAVSLNYSGRCVVRIKFYRRRLADYSRAISEKAIIDAIVSSGALKDDSEKEICLIDEGQVKVETPEEERTEVVIEYPEVDLDNLFIPREKFGNAGTKE